jgi:hypothetical protein
MASITGKSSGRRLPLPQATSYKPSHLGPPHNERTKIRESFFICYRLFFGFGFVSEPLHRGPPVPLLVFNSGSVFSV